MSDDDIFNFDDIGAMRPPNAPDTPDWWAISSALLRLDGLSESLDMTDLDVWTELTEELLGDLTTIKSMTWAAQQRSFNTLGISNPMEVFQRMDEVAPLIAAWIDGFVVAIMAMPRLMEIRDERLKEDDGE